MLKLLAAFASSRIIAAVLQGATLLLVARYSLPIEFAVFSATFGVLQLVQAVSDGGCSTALMRYVRDAKVTASIFRLGLVLGVSFGVASAASLIVIALSTGSGALLALSPLAVWVASERQCEVRSAHLMANSKPAIVTSMLVGRRFLTAVCVLIFGQSVGTFFTFSCALALTSSAASLVLATTSSRLLARGSQGARAPRGTLRETLDKVRPYWSYAIAQSLRQADTAVLSAVAPAAPVAAFAPASRLLPPLLLLPGTYSQLLLARLAREDKRATIRDALTATVASYILYLPILLAAPYWIPAVLGSAYLSSVTPLQVVLMGLPFASYRAVLTANEQAHGGEITAARAAWLGGVATLVLIFAIGHLEGAVGAALATGLGFVAQSALLTITAVKRRRVPSPEGAELAFQGGDV